MQRNILTLSLAALVLTTGALAQTSASSATGSSVSITKGPASAMPMTKGTKSTSMTNMAPLNVNTASLGDLEKIPGMNAKLAQAVVAARPFKNQADLVKKVKGIGTKNVKKFAPYLKFS